MKRNTCLLLVLVFPFFGLSQGVKANLFDKFLKKQRIETDPLPISGLAGKNNLSLDFTAVASTLYLNLTGAGWGASTIDKDNELVLLFSNDSSLTLKATSLQSFEPGIVENVYRHQYFLNFQHLDFLSKYDLVGIRKYHFDAYSDLTVAKENFEGIKKLSSLFLAELKSANITSTVKQISVKDIRNHIGDSVTFCSKVYRTRYFQGSEDGPTLLDVQADFSDPFVNVVILEKDRQKFNNTPENTYLNKDVCISGFVRLRNNLPYLIVQNKEQIKLNSPVNLAEIDSFEGDSVSVSGKVFTVRIAEKEKAQQLLLSMGAPYPNHSLTVVIENTGYKNLDLSAASYLNQNIRVSGKVISNQQRPQIVIRERSQLEIIAGQVPSSSFASIQEESVKKSIDVASKQGTKERNVEEQPNEKLAEFPGGTDAFIAYLDKNLGHVSKSKNTGERQVIASFEIDAQGICSDVKIIESAGHAYDEEVTKVLMKMPKWKPAFSNGRFIATRIMSPIKLKGI